MKFYRHTNLVHDALSTYIIRNTRVIPASSHSSLILICIYFSGVQYVPYRHHCNFRFANFTILFHFCNKIKSRQNLPRHKRLWRKRRQRIGKKTKTGISVTLGAWRQIRSEKLFATSRQGIYWYRKETGSSREGKKEKIGYNSQRHRPLRIV